MAKYRIKLYSKDKKSLHHLFNLSKCNIITQNFKVFFNLLRKEKVIKKVTVLKSPHVNKTAQEQFGYRFYSAEIFCYSWEIKKYLLVLKKIKNQLFPGIKIQINVKFLGVKHPLDQLIPNPTIFVLSELLWMSSKQKVKSKFLNSNADFKTKILLEKNLYYLHTLSWYGELR